MYLVHVGPCKYLLLQAIEKLKEMKKLYLHSPAAKRKLEEKFNVNINILNGNPNLWNSIFLLTYSFTSSASFVTKKLNLQ